MTLDTQGEKVEINLNYIFKHYYKSLLVTYLLFNVENVLILLKPYTLGISIDNIIKQSSSQGLISFILLYVAIVVVGCIRRMYDTRVFTKIYSDLAARVVIEQKNRNVSTSKIAARTSLASSLVGFFEVDITVFVRTSYAIIGSMIMMYRYNKVILVLAVSLLIPLMLVNMYFYKKNSQLTIKLNDQIEKTIDRLNLRYKYLTNHFKLMAKWKVKLSDNDAKNFSFNEFFVIILIVGSLISFRNSPTKDVGQITALFQYINSFLLGVDDVPYLLQQFALIKDVQRRINDEYQ